MTKQNKKLKLALVGYRLSGGGAENAMARLSILFENQGYEVHNIIIKDEVTYEFSGDLLNLGLLKSKIEIIQKCKRFWVLYRYLRKNKFDFIIDFRFRIHPFNEFLLSKLVYNAPVIFTVRSYDFKRYLIQNKFFGTIYSSASAIVCVSKQIENELFRIDKFPNLHTIYNTYDFSSINALANEELDIKYDYILGVGRMDDKIKQFDLLIKAFYKSELVKKDIKLVLIGDGQYLDEFKNLAKELSIENKVVFLGRKDNPFPYYKRALFTVLTSKNEGFPNVLIESLANNTPVVAFDCDSGPREIIENKTNGILVKNQDFNELVKSMDIMINDKKLYLKCKGNTGLNLNRHTSENVANQWNDLFYKLISKNENRDN